MSDYHFTDRTVRQRCADERSQERDFIVITDDDGEVIDHQCTYCGWTQVDYESGCREMLLTTEWDATAVLTEYLRVVTDAGLPIAGTITLNIAAKS